MLKLSACMGDEYAPILERIDQIASETKQSKSNVIRDLVVEALGMNIISNTKKYNTFKRRQKA